MAVEVRTQPASTRLATLTGDDGGEESGLADLRDAAGIPQNRLDTAMEIISETDLNGDTEIVASVLWARDRDDPVAVVSDDRRVRTVAGDFGATVTGTVGVVVRAVREGLGGDEAKSVVREIDSRGLDLTGELRETAFNLIDRAAGTDSGG